MGASVPAEPNGMGVDARETTESTVDVEPIDIMDMGRDLPRDLDRSREPTMPRMKPRNPRSRSRSKVKSEEASDRTEPAPANELRFQFSVGTVDGLGGGLPSKARKAPLGASWVSVRMMSRRRPGAGVQGVVESS